MIDEEATVRVIERLLTGEAEAETVEFKHNNADPELIGSYISGLSNSAALHGQPKAYVVWGVEDGTHDVIGTSFRPPTAKVGNEGLENWLTRLLDPQVVFEFRPATIDGKQVWLLAIDPAPGTPVRFSGTEYIRVGSQLKKLKSHREIERRLWQELNAAHFEDLPAKTHLDGGDVLGLLDYPAFFALSGAPLPENRGQILDALARQEMVRYSVESAWTITNLGAMLLARDLSSFPTVSRKALRIIRYRGTNKVETEREVPVANGYAAGFEAAISAIMTIAPHREVIEGAFRQEIAYPEPAIRELVANALIHQDFSVRGAGPMVEVFDNRVEITNPGDPLVPWDRFVNAFPQSRNEKLAGSMHLFHIAEERGTGWDKVALQVEVRQLPAPEVQIGNGGTKVVLFGPRPLERMDRDERVRAAYLHACLQYATGELTSNASIRRRFGLDAQGGATASRILRDAVAAGAIVAFDPTAGNKAMRYLPWWVRTAAGVSSP